MSSPKVVFKRVGLVHVGVWGEHVGKYKSRRDDGLALKFNAWRTDNDMTPVKTLVSGPGIHKALWTEEDAERVAAWLSENGAEEVREENPLAAVRGPGARS